ncbi:uncharacterized protein PAC_14487 [Phialocephala subalpina]|uniref:Zn(2)-C6 fungal-type domain-containing protein n=1 Tax=Phialocephala subalpina TaxID=576137 RepID=A0A1L7XHR6_9HELO|nr:uncharacterized protein PAC_14487 [Phialocephala subalpina]
MLNSVFKNMDSSHPNGGNGSHSSNTSNVKIPKRRSRLGCSTCRKRKVRCDEQKPVCSACSRLTLPCTWRETSTRRSSTLSVDVESNSSGATLNAPDSVGSPTVLPAIGIPSPNGLHFGRTETSRQTVTISVEDQDPLQHFVTTMTKFCILRNCIYDDLYGYILTNMGLFNQALFGSMMAWSFLHLSQMRNQPLDKAEARYEATIKLLNQEIENEQDINVLLSIIWFLLQYELLRAEGVDRFHQLLNCATNIAKGELQRHDSDPSRSRIDSIGCIVLVWMSSRDSQAANYGGTGRLLGYLKKYPYIYELIDQSSVVDPIPSASSLGEKESRQMRDCMRFSLRNMIVQGQIAILGRWRPEAGDSSSWNSVYASLAILKKEIEEDDCSEAVDALAVAKGSVRAMPTVSALSYNRLLLLASYYGGLISYHQFVPAGDAEIEREPLLELEECAARIIRITLRVMRDRPTTPQSIWPTSLFKAATTIKDPIYQAWAVRAFEQVEGWGANWVKTRILLENIIDRQNRSGVDVDFVKVMEETTGYFIV